MQLQGMLLELKDNYSTFKEAQRFVRAYRYGYVLLK